GECELQDFTFQEGRPATRYSPDYAKRFNPVEDFGPDVLYVPNRCILCTRCVRFMEDVAQEPVLNVSERGDRAFIGIHSEGRLDQDRKSTRLNSSHVSISYAVFCLKKKKKNTTPTSDLKNRRKGVAAAYLSRRI